MAIAKFMETFNRERQLKTENLINMINTKSSAQADCEAKEKLRTPWSVEEARASQSAMMMLFNQVCA